MQPWSAPDVPSLPGEGLPLRLYDTAGREVRPTAPGPTARMYVCGITPYDATHLGHAATYVAFDLVHRVWRDAGHDVHYVQNVTDVDDPLLERAAARRRGLGRAGAARDRAVPRGHDGAGGAAATALRRRGRVDPRHRRHRPAAARPGRGVRRRRRHLLLGARRPALRLGRQPRRRDHDRAVRRARRRPGPAGQEAPARLPALAGRAARRAVVGDRRPGAARGPARLARRVRRDRAGAPRRRVRRAGRRQRPGLPAPRDERLGGAGAHRQLAVRPALRARRHGRARRREDVEVQGQPRLRLRAAPRRSRPVGDPAGAARPPLPHRLEVDRGRPRRRRGPAGPLARGRRPGDRPAGRADAGRRPPAPRRRPRRPGGARGGRPLGHRCPRPRRRRRRRARRWSRRTVDALLGVRLWTAPSGR